MSMLSIENGVVFIDGAEVHPDEEFAIKAGTILALVQRVADAYTQATVNGIWPYITAALTAKAAEPIEVRVVEMPTRIHELSRNERGKPDRGGAT